jgi:hypothetical protein
MAATLELARTQRRGEWLPGRQLGRGCRAIEADHDIDEQALGEYRKN